MTDQNFKSSSPSSGAEGGQDYKGSSLNIIEYKTIGKRIGRGGYSDSYIINLRDREYLKPKKEYSKTGNHWTNVFFLDSTDYIQIDKYISNTGKHYCSISRLIIEGDKVRQIGVDFKEYYKTLSKELIEKIKQKACLECFYYIF